MKTITFCILFLCLFCSQGYAQDEVLERYSLPVFTIQDSELAAIVDEFLVVVQNIEGDYSSVLYIYVYIEQYYGTIHFNLKLSKQIDTFDSLVLYKNPNYYQAFVQHNNVLFRLNIESYGSVFNYDLVTNMIKRLPNKQSVYFKDPPPGYYDINLRGEGSTANSIYDSFHEYNGVEWYHGIRPEY